MAHLLVFGLGPIALEETRLFHAGGNRTWHLADALRQAGHRVTLLCMRVTSHGDRDIEIHGTKHGNLTYVSVDEITHFADDAFLQQFVQKVSPNALVGVCAYPAARAAIAAGDRPLWVDLHGYHMGEAQAKAFRDAEDGFRFHFWERYRPALERGDRFSVTSEPHKYALIGELGVLGRLNRHTFGEDLIHTIPIAWLAVPFRATRQRSVSDPFVVFWCGGFNTWCDVRVLAQALERAMERDNRVRFLSTGGAIDGHDEKTYPEFQQLVGISRFRARFDLRGWVPTEELPAIQEQVDLGVSVDRFCYETLVGARNRITGMIACGIPVLTTLGTEISRVLMDNSCALAAPTGDPEALAERILWAADHPQEMEDMARKARQLFEERYTYAATAKPLVAWADRPVRAGDAGKGVPLLLSTPIQEGPKGIRRATRELLRAVALRLRRSR
jgi:glycosyltransferase involved in cell wall biosynthesis